MSMKTVSIVLGGAALAAVALSYAGALPCSSGSCALPVLGSAALAAQPGAPSPMAKDQASPARAAEVYVLAFHAAWCGKCKALAPKIDELKKIYADKPVLFTGVDRTDTKDSRQAEYTLSALGLADLWKEHSAGPGFALVVKAADKSVVGKLTPDMDAKTMAKVLPDAGVK